MTRLTLWKDAALAAVLSCAIAVVPGSSVASAQGRDRTPPTAPTNLRITAVTASTVALAWSPSTDNSGRFTYRICCANVASEVVPQGTTAHVFRSGLEAGRSFTLRVYAVDAAGNISRPSNPVSFTLPADRVAPARPVVSVTDVGTTHVSLSWSTSDDSSNLTYFVFVDGMPAVVGTRQPAATIVLLDAQSTHIFTVQARDFSGNRSPLSEPVTVTTEPVNPFDVSPPTAPGRLAEMHFPDGEIHLTWDQSTDDFDPQWLLRYDIHINGVLTDVIVGRGRTVVYGNIGNNVVTVTAVDSAGNRSVVATVVVPI